MINLESRIPDFLDKLKNEVDKVIEQSAHKILEESNSKVPIDTGKLKESGYVKMNRNSNDINAEIGYTAEYALFVHENLNARHFNGSALFLMAAYRINESKIIQDVSNAIKEAAK